MDYWLKSLSEVVSNKVSDTSILHRGIKIKKNALNFVVAIAVFGMTLSANATLADYTLNYDYSASPVTLSTGEYPLIIDFDFGSSFNSYEDLFVTATFAESERNIVELGVILSNDYPPPSYATYKDWGYVVMNGSSQSVEPTKYFSWNSGNGSAHWDLYAPEISREILDGKFSFYFQNAPISTTPSLNSRPPFSVTSFSATLRGAEVSPVPELESYAMMLLGIGMLGFMARRRSNS